MEYNSTKGKLTIREYGRNVQLLIEHAKTIEDKAYRQAFAERIIDMIQALYPQAKNVEDYRSKLWSHVLRIANYELDVDTPETVAKAPEYAKPPQKLTYPTGNVRFRHYGNHVERMIARARGMEDASKKEAYATLIAGYMKMSHKAWGKPLVSDEVIRKDLTELSQGELVVNEAILLDDVLGTPARMGANQPNPTKRPNPNYQHAASRQQQQQPTNNANKRKGNNNNSSNNNSSGNNSNAGNRRRSNFKKR